MTIDILKKVKSRLNAFILGREDNYLLASASTQLDYLIQITDGTNPDKSKLSDISLGVIAVREIEGIDDELAEALYEIDYWVKNTLLPESVT